MLPVWRERKAFRQRLRARADSERRERCDRTARSHAELGYDRVVARALLGACDVHVLSVRGDHDCGGGRGHAQRRIGRELGWRADEHAGGADRVAQQRPAQRARRDEEAGAIGTDSDGIGGGQGWGVDEGWTLRRQEAARADREFVDLPVERRVVGHVQRGAVGTDGERDRPGGADVRCAQRAQRPAGPDRELVDGAGGAITGVEIAAARRDRDRQLLAAGHHVGGTERGEHAARAERVLRDAAALQRGVGVLGRLRRGHPGHDEHESGHKHDQGGRSGREVERQKVYD